VLTLDELPELSERHNARPDVRIAAPADGAHLHAGQVTLTAEADDRDGKVARIEFRLLGDDWWTWPYLSSRAKDELLPATKAVGACTAERPEVRWTPGAPGLYSVVARATDDRGGATWSNVVRLAVGLRRLGAGAKATASSKEENAGRAVDGDVWTAWSADRKAEDPQWLAIDLGSPATVGAAVVVWGKAHGGQWAIEVSDDGKVWEMAAEGTSRTCQPARVVFDPVEARHVRLRCMKRGTNWGGYAVEELVVYESPPAR
jgi:hypothetical protein